MNCILSLKHIILLKMLPTTWIIFSFVIVFYTSLVTCSLYPKETETREVKSLNGVWLFRPDYAGLGFKEKWWTSALSEIEDVEMMPVPSSFNDISQIKEIRDHVGWVWYFCSFRSPSSWSESNKRTFLRFGSVTHFASVWVNGQHLRNHTGGYLPFETEITHLIQAQKENFLVVGVNNTLTPETIPQGTLRYPSDSSRYPEKYVVQGYNFDYFNFAGIHRPVYIYCTPLVHVSDITLQTTFKGAEGIVSYDIKYSTPDEFENSIASQSDKTCKITIFDNFGRKVANQIGCVGKATIPDVQLWWPYLTNPKHPTSRFANLYNFEVRLFLNNDESTVDVYQLKFGVRTVEVNNNKFLINGKPFYFRGFGRHEDYNIRGRGVDPVMIVKDHNLLQWIGANSYRTSHYPYAEEILDIADQLGIAIIDESPAIGLSGFGPSLMNTHIQVMKDLVQRDKNRPSVVMWSIGNEPKSMETSAPSYFETVIAATRNFDVSKRPITIVLNQNFSKGECPSLDVISINKYFGWYSDTGRMEVIPRQIPTEVRNWFNSYQKPVLVTEYGAGTISGMHQNPSFVWTEDFQSDYLMKHFKAFDDLAKTTDYFLGEMIWNFADFATPEETFRPWGCMKGVFTRERQPKMAAHLVRARYWISANNSAVNPNLPLPDDLIFLYQASN